MSGVAIDARRLSELETTIERGLATFIEVGNALAEVRESQLYQGRYGTFENYCRERRGPVLQRVVRALPGSFPAPVTIFTVCPRLR